MGCQLPRVPPVTACRTSCWPPRCSHEFDNGPVILGEYLRNLTQVRRHRRRRRSCCSTSCCPRTRRLAPPLALPARPRARQVGIPAISCNLDLSGEPALAGSVERFVVVDLPVSGRKAGLVGLTTVQTPGTVGRVRGAISRVGGPQQPWSHADHAMATAVHGAHARLPRARADTSEVGPSVSFRPYNETLPACIDDARTAGADVIVLITHLG